MLTDKKTDTITVDKGIMFAYGYFGILPESIKIPFIKPSATQYRIIYAEIDRSVVPNTFKIKVKNNQGSNKIKPTTFRQDYLTAIKTGVFQLPLWQVELNNEGIEDVVDVRELKDYIKQVHHTNYTTGKVTKTISENAKATTQPTTNNSEKLATTEFVYLATRHYIGNPMLTITSNKVEGITCTPQQMQIVPGEKNYFIIQCSKDLSVRFMNISNYYYIIEEEIEVAQKNNEKLIKVPIVGNDFTGIQTDDFIFETKLIYKTTIIPYDETGKAVFQPSFVELSEVSPKARFKAILPNGYDISDYLYIGEFTLTHIGNLEYEVELTSIPLLNEKYKINFYVDEI